MIDLAFIGKVSPWSLDQKPSFPLTVSKVSSTFFFFFHAWDAWVCRKCMLGAHEACSRSMSAWTMLGAPRCAASCLIFFFSIFLGVCFHIRCIGTWEHNSSIYNVFRSLLNLHSWSSQSLHKSLNVLFCRFSWFLRELHLNIIELLCFEKYSYITQI